ncbi:MAG: FHA domain-containing protein, partial [Rubrivivax sp.]
PDPERTISRVHAQVAFRNGGFALIDRGSNPVLINGRALGNGAEAPLRPLISTGLLPRSMSAKPPLRKATCACTREMVRSGSGKINWLVSARPMVPPSSSKEADSRSVGPPLKVRMVRVITLGSLSQHVELAVDDRQPEGPGVAGAQFGGQGAQQGLASRAQAFQQPAIGNGAQNQAGGRGWGDAQGLGGGQLLHVGPKARDVGGGVALVGQGQLLKAQTCRGDEAFGVAACEVDGQALQEGQGLHLQSGREVDHRGVEPAPAREGHGQVNRLVQPQGRFENLVGGQAPIDLGQGARRVFAGGLALAGQQQPQLDPGVAIGHVGGGRWHRQVGGQVDGVRVDDQAEAVAARQGELVHRDAGRVDAGRGAAIDHGHRHAIEHGLGLAP